MFEEEILIDGYKKDFRDKTGRILEIKIIQDDEYGTYLDSNLNFYTILYIISTYTKVTIQDILSESKKRDLVLIRGILAKICRINNTSLVKISNYLNRHYSTIIHLLSIFDNDLECNTYTKIFYQEILNEIKTYYSEYKNIITKDNIQEYLNKPINEF